MSFMSGGVSRQDCQLQCVGDDDIAAMLKRIRHSKIQDWVGPENYSVIENQDKAYAVHVYE